jgi:protein SDA1
MLKDPNETATKRALSVMIELYKRKIWNDDKTVNVIAEGCLNDNPKIVASASKFFLVLDYEWDNDSEDEGNTSDEDQEQKAILGKYKGTKKMTKKRIAKVGKVLKQHKRKEMRKRSSTPLTSCLLT